MKINFDISLLESMIKEGYISKRKHPDLDIFIYNYTPKTQYERNWNEVTLTCRGLILDKEHNIIARPFRKFFNYEEIEEKDLPKLSYKIYEKKDGSLGILYWANSIPCIATRGSFESEQAVRATEILHTKYSSLFNKLNKNKTYLFEIIYPENRIVVDYKDLSDLFLLTIIDNDTGLDDNNELNPGFPQVEIYEPTSSILDLKNMNLKNKEGFVICFENSFRYKIKFEDYIRLHYLMTQISNKDIWESLSSGKSIIDELNNCPDEVFSWIKEIENNLKKEFERIEVESINLYNSLKHLSRKDLALALEKNLTNNNIKAIIFQLASNKRYDATIYKMIRPVERLVYKFNGDSQDV